MFTAKSERRGGGRRRRRRSTWSGLQQLAGEDVFFSMNPHNHKRKATMSEIKYEKAAEILGCSPRHVRRVLQRNGIKPIVHGYRTIRFPLEKVARLRIRLLMQTDGPKHTNGRSR
jgi:hypothetical protein